MRETSTNCLLPSWVYAGIAVLVLAVGAYFFSKKELRGETE